MPIPTEQIGSIPRPAELLQAMRAHATGQLSDEKLQAAQCGSSSIMAIHEVLDYVPTKV